jgi:ribosomal protein L37AE/L43A
MSKTTLSDSELKDGTVLVMLDDVNDLVRDFKYTSDNVSKKRPHHCPKCNSEKMLGVEVMGAYDGILFWECHQCDDIVLRFQGKTTQKYLRLAKGVWTNPSDWGYVPRSKFN